MPETVLSSPFERLAGDGPVDAFVHADLWEELPVDEHEAARLAMQAIARMAEPLRSPQVGALSGGAQRPDPFRLRAGRYRILFLRAPGARTLVFTTAFLKRRESDYDAAIARHDARVEALP